MNSASDILKPVINEELRKELIKRADEQSSDLFVIGADMYNSEGPLYTSKWLWRQECFSLAAKAVFMIILDHAYGKKDRSWPSQERIAKELGNSISIRTVQRAIEELRGDNKDKNQLLESIRRGMNKPNIYIILFRGHEYSYTLKDLVDTSF
jgi:hypothetical protein